MPLKFYHSYLIALVVAVALSFFAFDALAEEAVAQLYPVDFRPTLLEVVGVIFTCLSAFAAYLSGQAVALFKVKTGIDVGDSTRKYLLDAVDNGIKLAEKRVKQRVDKLDPIQLESEILATAMNYVWTHVPDALRYFELTDDNKLRSLISSRFQIDTTGQ